MTEKELDKLFESKLQSREFEMNPANWAAMEQMLDARARRAGGFYWRAVAGIVGFAVLAALALYILPQTPHNEPAITAPYPGSATEMPAPPARQNLPAEDPSPEHHSRENLATTPAGVPENTADKTLPENTPGEQLLAGTDAQQPSEAQSSAQAAPPASADVAPEDKHEGSNAISFTEPEALEANSQKQQRPQNPDDADRVELPLKGFPTTKLQSQLALATPATAGFTPEVLARYDRQHELFASGSSVIGTSFGSEDASLGYAAAVGYRYRFSQKFSAELAVSFLQLSNLGIRDRHDSTFFNFGREHIETRREVTDLQYLQLPIAFTYNPNPRHSLSLGIYTGMLMAVTEHLERTHEYLKRPTAHSSSKNQGYQEDFNRYDFGITASYFYRLSPDLSLGLQMQRGFTDITYDVSEGFEPVHRNFNTQLSLRYRFLSL